MTFIPNTVWSEYYKKFRDQLEADGLIPSPNVIGFIINDGTPGTNVGPELPATGDRVFTTSTLVVKHSDSMDMQFIINQNGSNICQGIVPANTVAGSVLNFDNLLNSLVVTKNDIFTIDILTGSENWQFTVKLEG